VPFSDIYLRANHDGEAVLCLAMPVRICLSPRAKTEKKLLIKIAAHDFRCGGGIHRRDVILKFG